MVIYITKKRTMDAFVKALHQSAKIHTLRVQNL